MADVMISEGPNGVIRDRPDAPYDLDDLEAEEWRALVSAMPPDHFQRTTYPLLTQLCRHIVSSRRIAQMISVEVKKNEFDCRKYDDLLAMQSRESAVIMRLERSMRLTQMSTINPTAGKQLRPVSLIPAPWNQQQPADDDEAS